MFARHWTLRQVIGHSLFHVVLTRILLIDTIIIFILQTRKWNHREVE